MSPQVAHAKSYPFPIPENSYVLGSNGADEILPGQPLPDISGLTPVLASGSNQSPEQLRRKFDNLEAQPIPVLKARIKDFDAVYSTHFTAYGSIPATIHYHPGVSSSLFVNWLRDEQLESMHKTEVPTENYHYVRLQGITLDIVGGERLSCVYAYLSQRGALSHDGKPLALEAVPGIGRDWPEISQHDVQALARDRLKPVASLDQFILENIDNADVRRERINQLASDALPFTWEDVQIINV